MTSLEANEKGQENSAAQPDEATDASFLGLRTVCAVVIVLEIEVLRIDHFLRRTVVNSDFERGQDILLFIVSLLMPVMFLWSFFASRRRVAQITARFAEAPEIQQEVRNIIEDVASFAFLAMLALAF